MAHESGEQLNLRSPSEGLLTTDMIELSMLKRRVDILKGEIDYLRRSHDHLGDYMTSLRDKCNRIIELIKGLAFLGFVTIVGLAASLFIIGIVPVLDKILFH